jgi:hypothetical protein
MDVAAVSKSLMAALALVVASAAFPSGRSLDLACLVATTRIPQLRRLVRSP